MKRLLAATFFMFKIDVTRKLTLALKATMAFAAFK
jgi:hypothetical protein